ncbi:MAG: hypothetical protein L3J24_01755 [Xanthomonadales bacterium]|nr:hypothetical protein [Xanthomonadales bacterium]
MKVMPQYTLKKLGLSIFLGLILGTSSVQANDVEVYRTQGTATAVKPNMLFVLDESSSMREKDGDSTTRTQELQAALRAIFAKPEDGGLEEVNAAFMGYSKRKYGGRRLITVGPSTGFYDVDKDRGQLVNDINDIYHISGTVTVQAMAAAVEWFKTGFTDDDGTGSYDGCYKDQGTCLKGTGVGSDEVVTTPVTRDLYCAQNSIILLTDGAPYSDQWRGDSDYADPNPYKPNFIYQGSSCTNPDPSGFSMNRAGCTGDIAEWGFNNDLSPSIQGLQNVATHTIGFHTKPNELAYLQDIALRGGGKYYPSSDTASLVAAFNAIATSAKSSIKYTFNAPLVPFNATNTAVTGEFIYVPVFEPSVTAFWKGNIKKYKISVSDSNITLSSAPGGGTVLGANNLFLPTARSYWGGAIDDGNQSLVGGAVDNFNGTRKLYTYVAGSPSKNLATNVENHVTDDNSLVTHAMLGLSTPTNINDPSDPLNIKRKSLIKWSNWTDDDNLHEGEMGAPIHTLPVVVDAYDPDNDVILMPTSEGVLEAIDAKTGKPLWAFMPEAMLKNISELKDNAKRDVPLYGLDGPMTVYKTNGKTMVVFGMRRGGRNYYALDITDRTNPKFAWEIIGGVTARFLNLGQTWSKPLFVKMEIAGVPTNKQVLAFGGGYDDDVQHDVTTRINDTLGKGVYIVNAETGAWITTYTPTDNLNGIAADLLPVDINANGIIDRFYAADIGGRIIRIDTPDSDFASSLRTPTSGVIADVNENSNVYHQFFNTPEVGYFNKGSSQFLIVLIGSGARPDPLDKLVTNSFYMIKDPDIWTAPATYETVTRDDLHNTTANLVQVGSTNQQTQALAALNTSSGWYINMPSGSGEKVFSKASLYDFSVLFTTYSGTRSNSNDVCSAGVTKGESQFWAVHMLTGAAVFSDLDGDADDLVTGDRTKSLNIPGMPPAPTLLFPGTADGPGKVVVALVGLQEVTRWPDRFHAIYWEQVIDGGGNGN